MDLLSSTPTYTRNTTVINAAKNNGSLTIKIDDDKKDVLAVNLKVTDAEDKAWITRLLQEGVTVEEMQSLLITPDATVTLPSTIDFTVEMEDSNFVVDLAQKAAKLKNEMTKTSGGFQQTIAMINNSAGAKFDNCHFVMKIISPKEKLVKKESPAVNHFNGCHFSVNESSSDVDSAKNIKKDINSVQEEEQRKRIVQRALLKKYPCIKPQVPLIEFFQQTENLTDYITKGKPNCAHVDLKKQKTKLKKALFCDSTFFKANFEKSNLENVDFSDTNLKEATFIKANVKNVNFNKAVLQGALLSGAKNLTAEQMRQSLWQFLDITDKKNIELLEPVFNKRKKEVKKIKKKLINFHKCRAESTKEECLVSLNQKEKLLEAALGIYSNLLQIKGNN